MGTSMPTSNTRVIEIIKNAKLSSMAFHRFEQGRHGVARSRLFREKAARIHPIIRGHTNKSLGLRFTGLCATQRLKCGKGKANTAEASQKMSSVNHRNYFFSPLRNALQLKATNMARSLSPGRTTVAGVSGGRMVSARLRATAIGSLATIAWGPSSSMVRAA